MRREFMVVYEKCKKNFSGFAPDVPGCGSVGKDIKEMRVNLREALQLYMDTSAEFGNPLPEAKTTTVTLPIKGENDPNIAYVVERITVKIPRSKTSAAKRRAMQAA